MKKTFFLSLVLFLSIATQAQKFAYIDTEYILEKIPEYTEAQKQLDALSDQWQKQAEKRYQAIDKMYTDLQSEEILLTESMKNKRQEEIIIKEQEAREFQKKEIWG